MLTSIDSKAEAIQKYLSAATRFGLKVYAVTIDEPSFESLRSELNSGNRNPEIPADALEFDINGPWGAIVIQKRLKV